MLVRFVFCWLFFTQTISISNDTATKVGIGMWITTVLGFVGLASMGSKKIRLAKIFFITGMVITILNFLAFLWLKITSVITYPTSDEAVGLAILFFIMAFVAGIFSVNIASEGLDDFFEN